MLVVHRGDGRFEHRRFRDLPAFLRPGDLLVLNDSRVIPARLWGRKAGTSGRVEMLLVEELARNEWRALLRPGRRVRPGTQIRLTRRAAGGGAGSAAVERGTDVQAEVMAKTSDGLCRLRFTGTLDLRTALDELGEVPLPPYIQRAGAPASDDRERYQTAYAREPGSVAAPTAGLHFTLPLLAALRDRGVQCRFLTLHVGLGTFAPVKVRSVEDHQMHEERYWVPPDTATAVAAAKAEGRRVIAVGTTTLRVLETIAAGSLSGVGTAGAGRTRLFVYPPFRFKAVDALLTNFHLPESTLLMLVSAFASPGETRGCELVRRAYGEAVREGYRFFSFGDAMLLL